jgi:hypothetical protein
MTEKKPTPGPVFTKDAVVVPSYFIACGLIWVAVLILVVGPLDRTDPQGLNSWITAAWLFGFPVAVTWLGFRMGRKLDRRDAERYHAAYDAGYEAGLRDARDAEGAKHRIEADR